MAPKNLDTRMNPLDAFFLFADSDTAPMTVGAVAFFQGQISLPEFRKSIAARIHRVPRHRESPVTGTFNLGLPTWEDAADFNLKHHVWRKQLRGTVPESKLMKFAQSHFEGPMPTDRPLWDMVLVPNVEHDQTAVVLRAHHAMIDGVAGVGLMQRLFDATPNPEPPAPAPPRRRYRLSGAQHTFTEALWDQMLDSIEYWAGLQRSLAEFTGERRQPELMQSVRAFWEQAGTVLRPTRRLRFNRAQNGKRRLAFSTVSLAEARAVRSAAGCTVNDVALTSLAGAMTAYLEAHGENTVGETLSVVCPVNVRAPGDNGIVGNQLSFMPVVLPLDIDDPLDRLHEIARRTRALKADGVPDMVRLLFESLYVLPVPVQKAIAHSMVSPHSTPAIDFLPQLPLANMVCTNVPGPDTPLYCCGKRMTRYQPVLPVGLETGMSCGVTSYAQMLYFTFVGDGACAPDVDLISEFHRFAFEELREAAGVPEDVHADTVSTQDALHATGDAAHSDSAGAKYRSAKT